MFPSIAGDDNRGMRIAFAVSAAVAACLWSAGIAGADTLTPDYAQVANGSGDDPSDNLTPGASPIQVPDLDVRHTPDTTVVVAHPYLAPWVHALVPVPANIGLEIRGAARVTLPSPVDGTTTVLNPNGHCVFGAVDDPALSATALAPIRIDTPGFQLVIDPALSR